MNTPTPTPRTDAATYPADCLGTTLVTHRDCARTLETELAALTAERDQLRAENTTLKATDTRPLLTGTLTHAGFCRIGEEQLDGVFISIDREQIKGLRHLPMYPQIELRVAAITEGAK